MTTICLGAPIVVPDSTRSSRTVEYTEILSKYVASVARMIALECQRSLPHGSRIRRRSHRLIITADVTFCRYPVVTEQANLYLRAYLPSLWCARQRRKLERRRRKRRINPSERSAHHHFSRRFRCMRHRFVVVPRLSPFLLNEQVTCTSNIILVAMIQMKL